MCLTDIYRTFHLNKEDCTHFSEAFYGVFFQVDWPRVRRIEMTFSVLFDQNGIKLYVKSNKNYRKCINS